MRERPWFQSIGSGRAGDHITTLGLVREAEILNALGRVIPNVKAVHVPLSGASSFTAFVSITRRSASPDRQACFPFRKGFQ